MISLLAVQGDVFIAETAEALQRKDIIDALGFLQTEHVRSRRLDELGDEIDAQAHRIDVPCCQGKTHQRRKVRSVQDDARLAAAIKNDLSKMAWEMWLYDFLTWRTSARRKRAVHA